MGKAARFACILVPMLCTISSLICIVLLLVAGTNKKMGALNDIYITKIDVRNLSAPATLDNPFKDLPGGDKLTVSTGFGNINADQLDLEDYYTSYLWSYCWGSIDDKESSKLNGCKKSKITYAFDIEGIIDDTDGNADKINFPENVQKVQKGVNALSKVMSACYAIAFIATLVCASVGWFGLLSRWGSCVTTIFADLAFGFLLIGSACATGLTYSIHGAFDKAFDEFGVNSSVGTRWMQVTWVATAFSFGAALFWLMSSCCCSGRTAAVMGDKKSGKRSTKAERTPYSYERVASPYLGNSADASSVPMQTYGQTGYGQQKPGFEPMRHGGV